MTIKERFKRTIEYFLKNMPEAETELIYRDPFELIVAVILSAQCTDKRVNLITPVLLKKFPDPFSMSEATTDEIFDLIKSCSYPNNKTKHLIGMSKVLREKFNGIVPSDTELLQQLPGVGRKTANVIASVVFNIPVMAVDTHVFRVSNRIGLTSNATTPRQVEEQLTAGIPEELMKRAHHWLILHGRYICKARKPLCIQCGLAEFCKYYLKNERIK